MYLAFGFKVKDRTDFRIIAADKSFFRCRSCVFVAIRNVCEVLTVSTLDPHRGCARSRIRDKIIMRWKCYLHSMFTRIIDASRVMNIRDRHSPADLSWFFSLMTCLVERSGKGRKSNELRNSKVPKQPRDKFVAVACAWRYRREIVARSDAVERKRTEERRKSAFNWKNESAVERGQWAVTIYKLRRNGGGSGG